jgi:hypothetical protein
MRISVWGPRYNGNHFCKNLDSFWVGQVTLTYPRLNKKGNSHFFDEKLTCDVGPGEQWTCELVVGT